MNSTTILFSRKEEFELVLSSDNKMKDGITQNLVNAEMMPIGRKTVKELFIVVGAA